MRGAPIGDLTATAATSGTITGSIELTKEQVDDLADGRLYVQLHSEKAPDGNLWGWLFAVREERTGSNRRSARSYALQTRIACSRLLAAFSCRASVKRRQRRPSRSTPPRRRRRPGVVSGQLRELPSSRLSPDRTKRRRSPGANFMTTWGERTTQRSGRVHVGDDAAGPAEPGRSGIRQHHGVHPAVQRRDRRYAGAGRRRRRRRSARSRPASAPATTAAQRRRGRAGGDGDGAPRPAGRAAIARPFGARAR